VGKTFAQKLNFEYIFSSSTTYTFDATIRTERSIHQKWGGNP